MLFAMMCLAVAFQHLRDINNPASDTKGLLDRYREKVIQCLVLSKYSKCAPYTLETLVLFLHVETFRSDDSKIEPWILLGVIIRLALRMGYHRDPSHFPHISPFQGEMRRRTWALIIQFDSLSSTQVGLPRTITKYETAEPSNLLDDDLYKTMAALPLARPNSFQTPVLYLVSKNRLLSVFGDISDLLTSANVGISIYPRIMQLDGQLNETYMLLPTILKFRCMEKSIMDSPDTIIRRLYIAIILQRAKCILHYKFMLPARVDIRYDYSRSSCIEAALQLLEYQLTLHQELRPGGRLSKHGWKVASVVNTSFFLASSLLSLELDYDITSGEAPSNNQKMAANISRRRRIIEALKNSYFIWTEMSDSSREARKAADVLKFVLEKAQKMEAMRSSAAESEHNAAPHVFSGSTKPLQPGMINFVFKFLFQFLVVGTNLFRNCTPDS